MGPYEDSAHVGQSNAKSSMSKTETNRGTKDLRSNEISVANNPNAHWSYGFEIIENPAQERYNV